MGSHYVVGADGRIRLQKDDKEREFDKLLAGTREMIKNVNDRKNIPLNYKSEKSVNNIINTITKKRGVFGKIKRSMLVDAPKEWNPFSALPVEKRILMAESIYVNGLLQPIVVRAINPENSRFEILSGHNRNECYDVLRKITGDKKYDKIDAKIYWYGQITDDQAREIISDTNFVQRAELPPRDKAFCIANKISLMKKKGERNGGIIGRVAKQFEISNTSVFYWRKLTNLIPEFEKMFSEGGINLVTANRIASFPHEIQKEMIDIKDLNKKISAISAKTPPEKVIGILKNETEIMEKAAKSEIEPLDNGFRVKSKLNDKMKILVLALPKKKAEMIADKYSGTIL